MYLDSACFFVFFFFLLPGLKGDALIIKPDLCLWDCLGAYRFGETQTEV